MKFVVTGSLGHISKPLTEELIRKGHAVTVISSKPERQKEIEALGANAAVGTFEDVNFLTETFKGADAVYCMITSGNSFFKPGFDLMEYSAGIGNNYKQAIQQSGAKRVVFLSSIGAHTEKGNGILAFYYIIENILNSLPSDIGITFLRPVGFYYNLLGFIPAIKSRGFIASNYGADDKKPWVSPIDIAAAVVEELETPLTGRRMRYVASDEITCDNIAAILGDAIGKPDLKWIIIPDEEQLKSLISAGMNPKIAAGLVEMNASMHNGILYEDYYKNRPALGKIKMTDYAKEFARIFQNN